MGFVPKIMTKLAVAFITLLFLSSTIDQAMAFETAYNSEVIEKVEDLSSYLNYKIDKDGNRHAIYLVGKDVDLEPSGDEYNSSHTLWYTSVNIVKFTKIPRLMYHNPAHHRFRLQKGKYSPIIIISKSMTKVKCTLFSYQIIHYFTQLDQRLVYGLKLP